MSSPPLNSATTARVVLLCGPSGSGKSLLAARSGLPVLRLDDFYKEGDDPTLPQVAGSPDIDWDHPLSWDADAAVAAIVRLCGTGRTDVPVYDISLSARTGSETVDFGGTPVFIAEGIFAAEIVQRCREAGVLADALCLSRGALTTFRRRFLRDLREGRKSVPFLLRRGWRLMRDERSIVSRQTSLGAYACGREEALERLAVAAERSAREVVDVADAADEVRVRGGRSRSSSRPSGRATRTRVRGKQRAESRKSGIGRPPGPPVPLSLLVPRGPP